MSYDNWNGSNAIVEFLLCTGEITLGERRDSRTAETYFFADT